MSSEIDADFIKEGIRFECQGSGKCCVSHDEYGYVYLTQTDRKRIARKLEMKLSLFIEKYCDDTDGFLHLKQSKRCQFLSGKRCSIYTARPEQCRTWPFWPETLNSKAWNTEVATFCPGVGKGPLFSSTKILKSAKKTSNFNDFKK